MTYMDDIHPVKVGRPVIFMGLKLLNYCVTEPFINNFVLSDVLSFTTRL